MEKNKEQTAKSRSDAPEIGPHSQPARVELHACDLKWVELHVIN
jgi:hypothetical protein